MQPRKTWLYIDYQVLHDAFFRNQQKMKEAIHGDVYYEGKEYQVNLRDQLLYRHYHRLIIVWNI